MKVALIGLLIGVALMVAAWVGLRMQAGQLGRYRARRTLLTDPEQVLFHRLRQAFPEHLVFAQVSLNQVISVAPKVSDKRARTSLFNKINGKSLDFLICGPDSAPLLAIELDDSSHDRKDRRKADQQKTEALESAELRLVRMNVKALPSTPELADLLLPTPHVHDSHDH